MGNNGVVSGVFFAIQCEQAIEEVYQVKEKKIIFEEIKK